MIFPHRRYDFFSILSFLFLACATSESPPLSSNNITIIGTLGGFIYGIDSYSLEKKWSLDTGGALLSAEQLTNPGEKSLSYALFPSQDGTLVYTGTDGIKASATTARALAAASPFLANGVLYRGEKIDKIMKVDLKTGNVLNDFGNTNNENHPPTLTGNESILLLGRTDFHIRAYDATSGLEQFNLSYGEVVPMDFKYKKRSIKDDIQYIAGDSSTSTSGAETPKISVGRKVFNSAVSISYDSGASNSCNNYKDGDSFLFSISNGLHSAPLYLDSSPTFSFGMHDIQPERDVLPSSENDTPFDAAHQNQFLLPSPSSNSHVLTTQGILGLDKSNEDREPAVVQDMEDRGRALVALPTIHVEKIIKNSTNNDEGSGSIQTVQLTHKDVSIESQCENPFQLLDFLHLNEAAVDHLSPSVLLNDEEKSMTELFTEHNFSQKELSFFAFIFAVFLIGLWRVTSLAFAVRPHHPHHTAEGRQGSRSSSLEIFHDKELGRGSNGTVVLEGVLEGKRSVAVKKMLSRFQKTVDREISLLSLSDGHPNVVRYFQSIRDGDFHLLVLELCEMSLWRYIEGKTSAMRHTTSSEYSSHGKEMPPSPQPLTCIGEDTKAALLQIVHGIAHLHSKSIIHRDVKPHNILLAKRNTAPLTYHEQPDISATKAAIGDFFYKISDMGLSKQLSDCGDQSCASFNSSSHSCSSSHDKGTIGWQPRELIQQRNLQQSFSSTLRDVEKLKDSSGTSTRQEAGTLLYKIDIFGLGCVFHYMLCGGIHPFGSVHDRERNILDGKFDVSLLCNYPDALDLISRMIDIDPARRPTAEQIIAHPFFWNAPLRLNFLNHLSERVQNPSRGHHLQFHLEANRSLVVGKGSWDASLPSILLQDLKAHGNYDFTTLTDCLRMLRNKRRHSEELSHEMKELITPDVKFNSFFLHERWPGLLMHCISIVCQHTPPDDATFEMYGCGMIAELFIGREQPTEGLAEEMPGKQADISTLNVTALRESVTTTGTDIAWKGSAMCRVNGGCRGWWLPAVPTLPREHISLSSSVPLEGKRALARHTKCLRINPNYRSHICEFKEKCQRKFHKKEAKRCTFAHDPVELKQRRKHLF